MRTFTIHNTLQSICTMLSEYYGSRIKNYGEATESLLDNQGSNYVTMDGGQYCSVNDVYDVVVFFDRQSATPSNQPGPGRKNSFSRNVTFKMVCNVKDSAEEFAIATILNMASHSVYTASDYDSKGIATTYFGLTERNFETFFFTMDFEIVEKITCQIC